MNTPQRVWLNGHLVVAEEAVVPVAAHGVLYGDGVFDTVRVYGGEPFRLQEHLERLYQGAAVIGLEVGWGAEALAGAVRETVEAHGLQEASVRVTALRGVGPPGPDPTECGPALVFITARPFSGYPERIYREGARALIATTRQNEHSPLCRVKSVNFLNYVLARVEARREGADEALLLNSRGEVAEGSVANVFVRFGPRLVTPPLESGCLPGLARAEILALAPGVGFEVDETPLAPERLFQADEALLTNSLMEVAPLVRVGDHVIGAGAPGEAARVLREAYRERVAEADPVRQ